MGRYYEIFFTTRDTHERESAPLMSVYGESAAEAKRKANAEVLRDGRSRRYDLAWTHAQPESPRNLRAPLHCSRAASVIDAATR